MQFRNFRKIIEMSVPVYCTYSEWILIISCARVFFLQRLAEARAAELERTRDERQRREQRRQQKEQQRMEEQ